VAIYSPGLNTRSMGERVECRVCGRMIGKGPEGLGIRVHAKRHREEFAARRGRRPEDYAEVRRVVGDRSTTQARFGDLEAGEEVRGDGGS
jgi:hypothetical protein